MISFIIPCDIKYDPYIEKYYFHKINNFQYIAKVINIYKNQILINNQFVFTCYDLI